MSTRQKKSSSNPQRTGRSGGGSDNGSAANGSKGGRSGGGRRRKASKRRKVDPRAFWGDPGDLPSADVTADITTDPSAVVRSLGRPPLSGQQNAADLYFTAVYERAVNLAAALAAAGNLIEPDELTNDELERA